MVQKDADFLLETEKKKSAVVAQPVVVNGWRIVFFQMKIKAPKPHYFPDVDYRKIRTILLMLAPITNGPKSPIASFHTIKMYVISMLLIVQQRTYIF